ncbi:MAG: hypothetical protein POG74_12400, partial [Acidocella sp.]|nr:hypothetical protein [Acidocella sp.]
ASPIGPYRDAGRPTLSPNNPLGVKGLGEAGTTGALAAVSNAIADALGTLGAELPSLPCTAEKLWRAMREGRAV